MNNSEKLLHLQKMKSAAEKLSSKNPTDKMSARSKMMSLFDEGSFVELNCFDSEEGQGVVTGYGAVNDRLVYAYVQNSSVLGGAIGSTEAAKILNVLSLAEKTGAPVVSIVDSKGVKIEEGIDVLNSLGELFAKTASLSGVVPQISIVAGPCAGGSVFVPSASDFVFVIKNVSGMFLTGPSVTRGITGKDTDAEKLGGANVLSENGVADFICESEEICFAEVRNLINYLPSNNLEVAVDLPTDDINRISENLNYAVADDGKPYDMKGIIAEIADNNIVIEDKKDFAKSMVTAFVKLNGATVGVVANQPDVNSGIIDIDGTTKAASFIAKCDSFNIPVVTFVDTDGFAIGEQYENKGISKAVTKLLGAYAGATVPKITVVVRRAYGSAYLAMGSKSVGADFVFAYPTAEIAVLSAEAAANILYNDKIAGSANPMKSRPNIIQEFRDKDASPYEAAKKGYVDDVIVPETTRQRLISALELLASKRVSNIAKKHSNI